jgi:hypothetical protein
LDGAKLLLDDLFLDMGVFDDVWKEYDKAHPVKDTQRDDISTRSNINTKHGGGSKDKKQEMDEDEKLLHFRKVFFETCFLQKIVPNDAIEYEKFLIKRINGIEHVIKAHFSLLHDTLRSLLRDALTKRRVKREKSLNLTFEN